MSSFKTCVQHVYKQIETVTYSRHRDTKSIKFVSVVLSIWAREREPTRRFLNSFVFRLRGMFFESKKSLRRLASASTFAGGKSITSIIMANCSASFSPGNIGYPSSDKTFYTLTDNLPTITTVFFSQLYFVSLKKIFLL